MKQIDIYIYTVSHSRGKGPAVFKAVLEFIKADGKPYTLDVNGGDMETTINRITIKAAKRIANIRLNEIQYKN